MAKDSEQRSELLAGLSDEFRQFSTATILFHQAIADRMGMHVTDHKCAEILLSAGAITAGELAQRTGLTTGAVTGVIDRLEKAGFVRRAEDPKDRRKVLIEPLPKRVERELKPLFDSIGQALANQCAQYSTRELAVIHDFIGRFHKTVYQESMKLREAAANAKPAKGAKRPARA